MKQQLSVALSRVAEHPTQFLREQRLLRPEEKLI